MRKVTYRYAWDEGQETVSYTPAKQHSTNLEGFEGYAFSRSFYYYWKPVVKHYDARRM